jgi:hypothetical protein
VVRLSTGVELTVLGPAKLIVQTGMQVSLEQGRLLARVPHWATGFTVLTRELEIYDLGTVFGVSADDEGSETFVFKGNIQVNEAGEWGPGTHASGAGVGICAAGAGVRARAGEPPVPFDMDGLDVERLFAPSRAAPRSKDPFRAMQAAREIGDRGPRATCRVVSAGADRSAGGREVRTRGTQGLCGSRAVSVATEAPCNSTTPPGPRPPPLGRVEDWFCYRIRAAAARPPAGQQRHVRSTPPARGGGGSAFGIGPASTPRAEFASAGRLPAPPGCGWGRLADQPDHHGDRHGLSALATLESGTLAAGPISSSAATRPAAGAWDQQRGHASALRLHLGHETNTYGRLIHNGGVIDCRAGNKDSSLQVGFNGGVGEFVARAGFITYAMGIGGRTTPDHPPGTGTVTVLEGAVGDVNGLLRVRNGSLAMRGGTIRLQRTTAIPQT